MIPTGLQLPTGLHLTPSTGAGVPQAPIVADQALAFGRLTLAGAGGTKPANTGGVITSASIDSGTNANHWQIASDGTITPSSTGVAASLSASYSLGCTFTGAGGSDVATITINTQANAYSVRSMSEAKAAATAIGTGGGVSILCRSAIYDEDTNFFKNRAFTSGVIVTPHGGATPVFSQIDISNSHNITLDGLTFFRSTAGTMCYIRNASDSCTIQNCALSGPTIDPGGDYSSTAPPLIIGIAKDGTTAPSNVSVLNNALHDVYHGCSVSGTGETRVEGNLVVNFYEDAYHFDFVSGQESLSFTDNVAIGCIGNGADAVNPHSDPVQFAGGSSLVDWEGIVIERFTYLNIYSRSEPQGIFMNGMGAGAYFAGTLIKGCVLVTNADTQVAGIRVRQSKNVEIYGCTVAKNGLLSARPDRDSAVGIVLGEGASTGTQVIKNCVADNISAVGTPMLSNNVALVTDGVSYSTAFAGSDFVVTSIADVR